MHILVFYILYFTAGTQTKSRLFLAPGMDIKAFLEFMDPYNRWQVCKQKSGAFIH